LSQKVTTASGRNQCMHQGIHGVCQSRRTLVSERAPDKRLKKRMREDGEAALAHANRGRPQSPPPCRTPSADASCNWPRGTYAGFKRPPSLREVWSSARAFPSVAKRCAACCARPASASPKKRRAPAHRQRRLRSARLGEPSCNSTAARTIGWKAAAPHLTALGMQDDATGKILAAQFFPSETTFGYLCFA